MRVLKVTVEKSKQDDRPVVIEVPISDTTAAKIWKGARGLGVENKSESPLGEVGLYFGPLTIKVG